VFYVLLSLIFGIIIEYSFPTFNKSKKTVSILIEVILQTITITLVVYIIEIMTTNIKDIIDPRMSNYGGGGQILGLVFIATQSNYINKLNKLEHSLVQKYIR
jgi:glycopeptide antibiotics resistance protein